MDPTAMMSSSARRRLKATRNAYPPAVFDLMTDILADLVLEDLRQFPQIPPTPRIDRFDEQENTVLLTKEGGE